MKQVGKVEQDVVKLPFHLNLPTSIDKIRIDKLYDNIVTETKNLISNDESMKTKCSDVVISSNNKAVTNNPLSTNFDENSFSLTNITIAQQQQQQQPNANSGCNTDSQYMDPLEHSLASLEGSNENKPELNAILILEMQKHHQQVQQLGASNQLCTTNLPQTHIANQIMPEFNGLNGNSMNGIMSVLGMQTADTISNVQFHQMKASRMSETWSNTLPVTSIQNIPLLNTNIETTSQVALQNFPQKSEKMLLTPKPIEELLAPIQSDKSKILSTPDIRVNYAFGQTFKYEQNIKNASSWSQLASVDPSHNASNKSDIYKSRLPSDTFQEFRTKAKEQQQRQKQEQEKIKMQKEQEYKRQQESLVKQGKTEEVVLTQRYELKQLFKSNVQFVLLQKTANRSCCEYH